MTPSGSFFGRLHFLDPPHVYDYSDVKLISSSGEYFFTSRIIMASSSTMFKNLFLDPDHQADDEPCIVTQFSSSHLSNLIQFLSNGVITFTNKNCGLAEDEEMVKDFLAFGVDLSAMRLNPLEPGELEKLLDSESRRSEFLYGDGIKMEYLDPDVMSLLQTFKSTKADKRKKRGEKSKLTPKKKPRKNSEPIQELVEEIPPNSKADSDEGSDWEIENKDIAKFLKAKTSKKEPVAKKERNPKKKFQCPHCVKAFNDSKSFKVHILNHENGDGKKSFYCLQCGIESRFDSREELRRHKEEFHIGKVYTCERCNKTFTGNFYHRFKRHVLEHDLPPRHSCVACGFLAKSSEYLARHRYNLGKFHNGICAQCPAEFKTWPEHENHVQKVHDGNFMIKCGICPKAFATIQRQRIHRRDEHFKKDRKKLPPEDDKSNIVCQFCGNLVKLRYYESHLENKHSTGECPCPHCDNIYKHPSILERHIANYHHPFPCEKCGKTIRNRQAYRLHTLSVHTPEHLKPHQCTVCDPPRGFHTRKNLRDHMNVHTNERPYKCKNCGAAFNNDANMFAHIRSTHKGIKRSKAGHKVEQDSS